MKALIDTNVLLDVLTEREPFYEHSAVIWSLVEKNLIKGYISAISVNNIYYITKKLKGRSGAEQIVDKIIKDFKVISLTYEILKLSRTINNKDFEDTIQYFSALQNGCEYIITRNKKDFPQKKIRVIEPVEFIGKYYKPPQ
ncbi:MAG: PIN domain-containing protein [bacterium]|nr:PIN domain-containing protein [bacterium]